MSLQDILGGGAAGASGPPDMGGGPPPGFGGPPPTDPSQGGGGEDADDLLQTAIDAIHSYIANKGSDDVDTATAAQCLAKLQQIKATDQKNSESAMGTQPAHKAMGKVAARLAASQ